MTIAIIIIVILSLAVVFLLIVIITSDKTPIEYTLEGWTNEDLIDFAQGLSNYEVTDLDLREWVSKKELEQLRFSDN